MTWHAKKWKVNVCGWFIHRAICWIYLFLIWQSEFCGQHCTHAVLHQSHCFEYPLKFLVKSSYHKCLYVFKNYSPKAKLILLNNPRTIQGIENIRLFLKLYLSLPFRAGSRPASLCWPSLSTICLNTVLHNSSRLWKSVFKPASSRALLYETSGNRILKTLFWTLSIWSNK